MKLLLITLVFLKLQFNYCMIIDNQRSSEDAEPASFLSNEQYSDEEMEYTNEKPTAALCSQDGNQKCSRSGKRNNVIHEEQSLPSPYEYFRIPNDVARIQYANMWNNPWEAHAYGDDNPENNLQYPHLHTNLKASMNRIPPVSYLPPVASIHVHESLPVQDQQAFLSRPVRVVQSRDEEDFLAELSHRAIMNNMIPTMQVPFVRSSHPYQVPYGPSEIAMFPYTPPVGALPIMLSCAPNINRGTLGHRIYRKQHHVIPPPEKVYEKVAEITNVSDKSKMENDDKKLHLKKKLLKHLDYEEHKVPNLNGKQRDDMLKMKNDYNKQLLIKQVGKEKKSS